MDWIRNVLVDTAPEESSVMLMLWADLLGYPLRDVDLGAEARHAQVGGVGVYRGPALAAQDLAGHGHQLAGRDRLHVLALEWVLQCQADLVSVMSS